MTGAILGFNEEASGLYAPALAGTEPAMEIRAVSGLSAAQIKAAAAQFPGARLYPCHEELLAAEKGLDFALVSGPAAESRTALKLAIGAGLHAAVLPPFCSSVTEFNDLAMAAGRTRKVLFALQPWERSAAWRSFSRTITEGLLGDIKRAEVRLLAPCPAGPGGITAGLGWQAFALLLGTVRRPPLRLAARLGAGAEYEAGKAEDEASFQVHFTGATGAVYLAAGSHAGRLSICAVGDKGMAVLDGGRLTIDLPGGEPRLLEAEDLGLGLLRPQWLARELEAFAEEMKKSAPDGAGLKNSLYCVKLLKNAYYSASVNSAAVPL